MHGLADAWLREILTSFGGYDGAVTEFIRVTDSLLPRRSFYRVAPELRNRGCTAGGTPTAVQLLGSDPHFLAINAVRLARLGPAAVDLNFGCPAPTVNRHRGGAVLLDEPELIHRITAAVRRAVPRHVAVTAKMRLGVRDTGRAVECVQALAEAGSKSIVVHARTRDDMYKPPARWEWLGRLREAVATPVIANGEVWTVADWQAIRAESGCADVMLGRGAVADPLLARKIRAAQGELPPVEDGWAEIQPVIGHFWRGVEERVLPQHAPGRLKLWLGLLCRGYPEGAALQAAVKPQRRSEDVRRVLAEAGIEVPPATVLSLSEQPPSEKEEHEHPD